MSESMQETVAGNGSRKGKEPNGSLMDIDEIDFDDEDDEMLDKVSLEELGQDFLKKFCKKTTIAFFEHYGLISHQVNSYNDFVNYGLQKLFDSIGEIIVQPGFDPSKRGDGDWRYASVKFGKVKLERPKFWSGDKFSADGGTEFLDLLPRHARIQNVTYSARMNVETHIQVNICLHLSKSF